MLLKKSLISTKGMSLIEVMIVVTIMGFVGLGAVTMMKNMVGTQKRTDLKSSAAQIKSKIEQYIKDDAAWSFSVANNNELACLRSSTGPCTNNASALPASNAANWLAGASNNSYRIYDSNGAIYFNGNSGVPNGGLTPNGEACNTFNAVIGSGDNDCPFRYILATWYKCSNGQPTCTRPRVIVRGELLFNPKDVTAVNARINVDDYRIEVERGRSVRVDTFEIVFEDLTPNTQGGGNCNPAGFVRRPFTSVRYDSGDNVELTNYVNASPGIAAGFTRFRLQPGSYECKVTTQSFEPVNGYRVTLRNVGTGTEYPAGGGFAGEGSTAESVEMVHLVLPEVTPFELRHYCEATHNTPAGRQWDLGIPVRDYSNPTVYTEVACKRSS